MGTPSTIGRVSRNSFTGAASAPLALRLWTFPSAVILMVAMQFGDAALDTPTVNLVASLAIAFLGIPHGALDIEIAAERMRSDNSSFRVAAIALYLGGASAVGMLWVSKPEIALVMFLAISILHFSQDWAARAEPFLAVMAAWALIALPAATHEDAVAAIFSSLINKEGGAVIASLLASSAAPATLGAITFGFWSWHHGERHQAIELTSCLIAALLLPPLVAFALYFCVLHSPRHLRAALARTPQLSTLRKVAIMTAVSALAIAFGVGSLALIDGSISSASLLWQGDIVRITFILLSMLTVPHMIFDAVMDHVCIGPTLA